MRILFVLPVLMLTSPALAAPVLSAPDDAECAATFTLLAQNARAQGLPSGEFERIASIAGRRAPDYSAGLDEARDLSLTDLQARVVNCHARYDRMKADTRIAAN
jgi:hypothetical protein